MHTDDDVPAEQVEQRPTAVVCLRAGDDPADCYLEQLHALGATEWAPAEETDDAGWVGQAGQMLVEQAGGEPVHLLVSGRTVPRALQLAVRHPDLVCSILASDPVVDEEDPAYWELLARVQAPTLVLVAAPHRDSDTSQAQTVAGGVDNGVMVIIDGAIAPVHRQAPQSFNEWVTAFMSIAEGLRTLASQHMEEAHA